MQTPDLYQRWQNTERRQIMRLWDVVRTANSNLKKSKLRTFLTVSAVFIGALTLMLTTGVGAGLESYVDEQVNSVGAKDILIVRIQNENNPISSSSAPKEYDPNAKPQNQFSQPMLTDADIEKIRNTSGILEVTPVYGIQAQFITTNDKKFLANLSQTADGVNQPLVAGRLVDVDSGQHEVTIPKELVNALGFKDNQDAVGKTATFGFKDAQEQIFTMDVKIVGVQEASIINGSQITSNVSFMKTAFEKAYAGIPDSQRNKYPIANARFDKSKNDQQIKALQDDLKKQGFSATTLDDILGIITSIIDAITTFLNIFAGIALIAATFGIINTLMMAVQERTKEIGLMKALGMSKSKIFALFSFEAISIGFWGALIALGVANILGRIGSKIASETLFKDFAGLELFSFPALPMIGIILLIMFISFMAGALPSRRASKLDPIEALRYE
jgi:putative ABC transport system permease protein